MNRSVKGIYLVLVGHKIKVKQWVKARKVGHNQYKDTIRLVLSSKGNLLIQDKEKDNFFNKYKYTNSKKIVNFLKSKIKVL